jgi:hypothetical protein
MFGGDNDETVPRQRKEERPTSLSEPLPREKLPKDLQNIIDQEDDFLENLYEGEYVVGRGRVFICSPNSGLLTPQIPIIDMLPTPLELEQSS